MFAEALKLCSLSEKLLVSKLKLKMKKILFSAGMIIFVAAVAYGATGAFFSDTETSTGNTFTAGAIDLKVDSKCTYNGATSDQCGTWDLKDLVGGPQVVGDRFFNFSDIKPGDKGENTVSLHVYNNDAWACVNVIPTKNDDVSSTEPELAVDVPNTDSIYDGELAQNMNFKIWADICTPNVGGTRYPNAVAGNNIYEPDCDILLTQGAGPIVPTAYALATPAGNVFGGVLGTPLNGTQTYYLGAEWSIPTTTGNIAQTDTYQADISFYVEQSRNNPNFVCPTPPNTPANNHSLRLENETINPNGPWTIINDNKFADLTWTGDANEFNYTLNAQGLAATTNYSLIYYADGWPGNNPGAFIGSYDTDGAGVITSGATSTNLVIDLPTLPDGNFAVGAKIWLVLSSDYNPVTKSMIAWNPADYLFEGNVYIHYNDLNNI